MEYFLFNKFAIVDPEIPDPMMQKSSMINKGFYPCDETVNFTLLSL